MNVKTPKLIPRILYTHRESLTHTVCERERLDRASLLDVKSPRNMTNAPRENSRSELQVARFKSKWVHESVQCLQRSCFIWISTPTGALDLNAPRASIQLFFNKSKKLNYPFLCKFFIHALMASIDSATCPNGFRSLTVGLTLGKYNNN